MKGKVDGKAVEDEYLKLPQVAQLLGISPYVLEKCTRDGLPIIKIAPRTRRVNRESLEQWLKNREVTE